MELEARRSARIVATFLVAIEGIDAEPVLRRGDISATGVYFEIEVEPGEAGTIHWLQLVSADRVRSLHIMAHVVRAVNVRAARGLDVSGVAFQFMPESDEVILALREFVRYVLALRKPSVAPPAWPDVDEPHVAARLDAAVEPAPDSDSASTVRELTVRSMVLQTSWAVTPGDPIRVDIVAPGMTRRIRVEGHAVRVDAERDGSRYNIEVEVQQETKRPLRNHSSMHMRAVQEAALSSETTADEGSHAVEDLLSALILPPERQVGRTSPRHLSGVLEQVRLPTLFSLFAMERMTGRLLVRHDDDAATIYLRDGELVDVEPIPAPGATPRARIAQVLAWERGAFEFSVEPVRREDRVQTSTTALLLDLAREADEAARDRKGA